MIVCYVCAAITLILILTILCLYSKIRIAIKIMQCSADYVTECCFVEHPLTTGNSSLLLFDGTS